MPHKTYLLYKPYLILSQFTDEGNKKGLKSILDVEDDIYPIGRLDADSEGMLLLSNQKELTDKILNPKQKVSKTYWAQVEGAPSLQQLKLLEKGITINIKGKTFKTGPAKVSILKGEPKLPTRNPGVRFRKEVPTTWVELKISEGKNRQVRKMLAAINFPVLRLVRVAIGGLNLPDNFKSGQLKLLMTDDLNLIFNP
jgi:23S rRNA pseudouridine2457 synthase